MLAFFGGAATQSDALPRTSTNSLSPRSEEDVAVPCSNASQPYCSGTMLGRVAAPAAASSSSQPTLLQDHQAQQSGTSIVHNQIKCVCSTLVSDNAQTWHSRNVKKWCAENGVTQRLTASYMPKSSGMCERQVGVLKGRMKKMSMVSWDWRRTLPRAVRILNHSVNESTLHSASELKNGMTRDGKKVAERVREQWIREAQELTRRQQRYSNDAMRKKYGAGVYYEWEIML